MVGWAIVVFAGAGAVSSAFAPGPLAADFEWIDNPVGVGGGDRVEFTDRTLTVNGRVRPIGGTPRPGQNDSLTVPAGSVFLLGDHATVSIYSRAFGPVPVGEVVARERFVLPA